MTSPIEVIFQKPFRWFMEYRVGPYTVYESYLTSHGRKGNPFYMVHLKVDSRKHVIFSFDSRLGSNVAKRAEARRKFIDSFFLMVGAVPLLTNPKVRKSISQLVPGKRYEIHPNKEVKVIPT